MSPLISPAVLLLSVFCCTASVIKKDDTTSKQEVTENKGKDAGSARFGFPGMAVGFDGTPVPVFFNPGLGMDPRLTGFGGFGHMGQGIMHPPRLNLLQLLNGRFNGNILLPMSSLLQNHQGGGSLQALFDASSIRPSFGHQGGLVLVGDSSHSVAAQLQALQQIPTATSSAGSVAPVTLVNSVAPATSVNSVVPVTSVNSVTPVTSVNSVAPVASVNSVAPATSVNSVAPVTSVNSVAPATSVNSVVPVTSVNSVTPVTSVNSVAPVASVNSAVSITRPDPPPQATVIQITSEGSSTSDANQIPSESSFQMMPITLIASPRPDDDRSTPAFL